MDYSLLFACLSLVTLCHLLIGVRYRQRPHWIAGINLVIVGIVCPLAAIGVLFIALGALLVL